MRFPTIKLVFDRKHQATKTKKGLVQLCISYKGVRRFVGTGVKVYANQWDDQVHVKNSLNSMSLNEQLAAIVERVRTYFSEGFKNGEAVSTDGAVAFLGEIADADGLAGDDGFLIFIAHRIDDRADVKVDTVKQHRVLYNALVEFGRMQSFRDVTKANVSAFDDFLHKRGYRQSTVYGYHTRLKRYINEAIRMELLGDNPYNYLKFKRGKGGPRKYLTEDEVVKVGAFQTDDYIIDSARDLFLFQCYTGLAYADLDKFDFERDAKLEDGQYVIRDTRLKTNEEYFLVLLSPAVRILEKYGFRLPALSNQQYNMRLKLVSHYAGLDKMLTTHMARHTFAVMALKMGVKVENLAKMMGHSNIKTTQIYAKVLNASVRDEFGRMERMLSGNASNPD